MLKDFQAGDKIRHIVLIKVQKVGSTSTGGVFARGVVQDNSASINFICFDAGMVERMRKLEGFVAMQVIGQIDINKFAQDSSLQLVINKLEEVLPEDNVNHLLPLAPVDMVAYQEKLKTYLDNLNSNFLKKLLAMIFADVYQQYIKNPAGSKLHHAYIGGLLEHCIDVTDLAVAMAKVNKNVNLDLVICGALLHDLGKIMEISADYGFPYTTKGRLLGHISMTAMLINSYAEKINSAELVEQELEELLHIVLSHHGEQEKGSPIACATKESFIVHYADELNAVLNQFENLEDKNEWVFKKMINRYLYVKGC